jgi:AraC family transcriptional regulator of adaptative response / DNA-3-methyladenine glycosylase II
LDEGSTEDLAARLGVGARHLRRLFVRHVGAPPIAVAQTRRLLFAKTLIDQTPLPLAEIALASGFGSIRRFNAAFQRVYSRPPSEFRRWAKPVGDAGLTISLAYRPPFDWKGLLDFLALRATPGVEVVEGCRYSRTISLGECSGWFSIEPDTGCTLRLRIAFADARWLFEIIDRVRRLFDLDADPNVIASHLAADPLLANSVQHHPGLRVPGCWDGFELAVRAVLGQQITVKAASTLAGRIAAEFGGMLEAGPNLGHLFPRPEQLAGAPLERVGLTAARATTVRALASAVVTGQVSLDRVALPEKVITELRRLPGIGDWTAQYISMRALGEPDAFPAGDLGLRKAVGASPEELIRRAESWRPWRAYAAMHLWQGLNVENDLIHRNRQPRGAVATGRRRTRPPVNQFFERLEEPADRASLAE